ncbi:MAG: A/G-specific adenine glycosylase [Tatlockia sp.]|jgi:A/G-specific adenine glycosylase
MSDTSFSAQLLAWFDCFGRKNLPWQHPRSAYRVWISEIMLQQTQVKTVIPYFTRFIETFPDVMHLANASEDAVLALWSGLGYYSRARNLIKTAAILCDKYQGQFPVMLSQLVELPGIGPSTAAAIASQAFNQPTPILDANVKRVLCRHFAIGGYPERAEVKQRLWQLAKECMPENRCADYTQAIMDLGATCCTPRAPACSRCPLEKSCLARQTNSVFAYPEKKEKKILPLRAQHFLLIHNSANQIYLEKRPPQGIWASLWCTPTVELEHNPIKHLQANYPFTLVQADELMQIKHTFSHFHLKIHVLLIQVQVKNNCITEPCGKWFHVDEIARLGIARPISDMIQRFTSQRD